MSPESSAPIASGSPFAAARAFEALTLDELARSRRAAWRVAAAACALACCACIALAFTMPLHQVVPVILQVDRSSGDVRQISVSEAAAVPGSEILDKHWITSYVVAREGYHWGTLQTTYNRVLAMSAGDPERDFQQLYSAHNPVALDKLLGNGTERRVRVVSVVLPPGEPGRAVVRIERTTVRSSGLTEVERFLVSLAYEYRPASWVRERVAVLNPLGFTVVAYRADPEFTASKQEATP